jgi:hypothetical protein
VTGAFTPDAARHRRIEPDRGERRTVTITSPTTINASFTLRFSSPKTNRRSPSSWQ